MMKRLGSLAAALLLVACVSPFGGASIAPGTPRDDVIAKMGQPTRVVLPGKRAHPGMEFRDRLFDRRS